MKLWEISIKCYHNKKSQNEGQGDAYMINK